uniref:Uncharacterized protein n=1 Tax=Oryza brachyantha TaxID=4533 RepID=J3NC55_ORYBR
MQVDGLLLYSSPPSREYKYNLWVALIACCKPLKSILQVTVHLSSCSCRFSQILLYHYVIC